MASLSEVTASVTKKFSRINPDIIHESGRRINWLRSTVLACALVSGGGYPNGGFPRGRISEVFGMEHSGKTNLMLDACAQVQRDGGVAVFMDHENSWDPQYAEKVFGLREDGKTFIVFQPDNLEEGDLIVEELKKLDRLDLLVFDSVDAMRPKAAIESIQADGDRRVGSHAMGMGRIVAKVKVLARQKQCAAVFINQMRTEIRTDRSSQSVGTAAGYNPMESYTTTGGHALRFYASVRYKCEYGGAITDETDFNPVMGGAEKTRIGHVMRIINVKNKCGAPYLKGEARFYYSLPHRDQIGGFAPIEDLMEMLKRRGRIAQTGAKLKYFGLGIKEWSPEARGKLASEKAFKDNPQVVADAYALLQSLLQNKEEVAALLDTAQLGTDYEELEVSENADQAVSELKLAGFTTEATADPDAVGEPSSEVAV
jgi:recombination protein RecA